MQRCSGEARSRRPRPPPTVLCRRTAPSAGDLRQAAGLVDQLHAAGMVGSYQLYHGLLQVGGWVGGRCGGERRAPGWLAPPAGTGAMWWVSATSLIAPHPCPVPRPQACQTTGQSRLALETFLGMQVRRVAAALAA